MTTAQADDNGKLRTAKGTPAKDWNAAAAGSISGSTPLWSAARLLLAAHGKEFFKRWRQVAQGFHAEDIHDLRVASRRLREALALFEPCFEGKSVKRLRNKVKQVTGILGGLRNTDEAILFFNLLTPEERQPAQAELKDLLQHLEQEREAARRQLETDLGHLKPGPIKKGLQAELAEPLLFGNQRTDPFQGLARFADGAIAERSAVLGELLSQALFEANAGAQHRLRIAVKRVRYRLEILQPLFKEGFDEMHGVLKRYQDVLGKLHDLDVFAELALERVPDGAGQQQLLRVITARRSGLFAEFRRMVDALSVDAIGTRARRAL